ncbi:hypothetical protein HPP92_008963 [Vanilla planifolia]|uniref:Uncharacterized protein n=1 Tax=Vanilla planifolia TaxID=51239 RepID=A0A835RAL7_VANPL|nr:hypothetical protein HPP92_008963 [Vanilla planifolia]
MDSAILQSPVDVRSPKQGIFPGADYESMLRESLDRFLAGIPGEGFDFSGFRSVLSRYLQSSVDPPLEIVWLYSAASYYESIAGKKEYVDRVRSVRNLFQILSTCSAACGGVKCIALIAPVVYDLYRCAAEGGLANVRAKKEIKCLADGILSYVSICCGQSSDMDGFSSGLHSCFFDLVRAWSLSASAGGETLGVFFPLVNGEVWKKFGMEGCGIGYLAAVVIAEAFLFRLSLKVKAGSSVKDLQKDLGIWAVSSITVFHNRMFFEILLRLLLDPKALANTLLDDSEEEIVRGVLYDAVILVDYSFLQTRKEKNQYDRMTNLLVTKLIVANKAVNLARAKGDHNKAISFLNAFSTSSLPIELTELLHKEIDNVHTEKRIYNSPEAFLRWLLHLEKLGYRILDDEDSQLANKLIYEESTPYAVGSDPAVKKKTDAELFFVDRGEPSAEAMEPMDAVFSAAAQAMKQFGINGRVKRKEARDETGKMFKSIRYDMHSKQVEDSRRPVVSDETSSDSEVDNPQKDDAVVVDADSDMEDSE